MELALWSRELNLEFVASLKSQDAMRHLTLMEAPDSNLVHSVIAKQFINFKIWFYLNLLLEFSPVQKKKMKLIRSCLWKGHPKQSPVHLEGSILEDYWKGRRNSKCFIGIVFAHEYNSSWCLFTGLSDSQCASERIVMKICIRPMNWVWIRGIAHQSPAAC